MVADLAEAVSAVVVSGDGADSMSTEIGVEGGYSGYELGGRGFAHLGPLQATKPVISRRRINRSYGKTPRIPRKYYRPF